MTELLPTHTPKLFESAVRRASDLLRRGDVVALPTETVYGLAANALDERAVARIYEVKGRPVNNPIIVHVASEEMARSCAANWPGAAQDLSRAFWPGPLTVVLQRRSEIPDIVAAGGSTVGIRWPSHPFMQAVIRECNFPLAAPSANLSNRVSPTNADHVHEQLEGKIPLIVDGGQSQVGIESTVIDLTTKPARVLRPGIIHEESLAAVLGEVTAHGSLGQNAGITLKSPGLLAKHYAPLACLLVMQWENELELMGKIPTLTENLDRCHVIAHTVIPSGNRLGRVSVIPHDAEAFARALYAELHRCDAEGAELIIVEAPPDRIEWTAVADRLRRASTTQPNLPIGRIVH